MVAQGSGRLTAPEASVVENAKETAIRASETVISSEPVSRMGFRPTRSTRKIAIRVTSTLVTEVITLVRNESDSENPTACQSVVE